MTGDRKVRVAVVGGGISGLTAALRLSQRGYQVTLYEEKHFLGGNLASREHGGRVYYDVYPHLFSNFYVNFWDIAENDLGLRRDKSPRSDFAYRESMKFLGLRQRRYMEIRDAGSLQDLLGNLFSGVAPPLDIYLWTYSMLDMLAHPFDAQTLMGQYSVSGFVQSRAYATERVIALHDFILMLIWSVHAAKTSASSYRSFLLQSFGNISPLLWLLKGSLEQKLIGPLEEKLRGLGCDIHKDTRVVGVVVDGGRVTTLKLQQTSSYAGGDDMNPMRRAPEQTAGPAYDAPDHVVLAVPPAALALLVENGEAGRRIVDRVPHLSELQRLNSEPIAVLDLYFTRKLDGIPPENVAMVHSTCDLSFIDLSQLWDDPAMRDVPVLTVAASDYWALSSEDAKENGQAMIQTLHDSLPLFDPGKKWGESPDIDWTRTHYESNKSDTLFINQVGSEAWRPQTHYAAVSNLFFAGDLCLNKIDMATVEAAVTSGLNAAIAIQKKDPLGEPIKIARLPTCPETAILAMKLLMAPSAYGAKWLAGSRGRKGCNPQRRASPRAVQAKNVSRSSARWWRCRTRMPRTGCSLLLRFGASCWSAAGGSP